MTTVAAEADLAPSALYHYFGGKAELYEAVFDSTVGAVWGDMAKSIAAANTMVTAVDLLFETQGELRDRWPGYTDFLLLVPMECTLHPEFEHLLELRSKYQDGAFGAIADLGLATGELRGIDRAMAVEMLRAAIMGSSFERRFRGEGSIPLSVDAVRAIVRAVANRAR